jgi:23S rRNA (cytosine1962-C5)-methyltransferase
MARAQVVLKPGREGPISGGHPWVFSGAVAAVEGKPEAGSIVAVRSADGTLLGCGSLHPVGAITVRLFSRDDERIDAAFVRRRIGAALALRRTLVEPGTTAYRLVNGEGDGLPGIVADWYDGWVVVQYATAGAERLAELTDAAIIELAAARGIYERSEGQVRRGDGLRDRCGGRVGDAPPELIRISESGMQFLVDVRGGQKTGFFLDQRPNRRLVRALAGDRSVLNVFAYTGGFAVAAGLAGARRVVSVDTSVPALTLAQRIWQENGLPADRAGFVHADAFEYFREAGDTVDVIVLDPPAFAKRQRDVAAALRGYREINRQAFLRLQRGGWLLTCSCSHHVLAEAFRHAVMSGAAEAHRSVQIVQHLHAGPDHPIAGTHGEADYLKGYLVRVLD